MGHAAAVVVDAWKVVHVFRRSHLSLQKPICINCRDYLGGRHQQWICFNIKHETETVSINLWKVTDEQALRSPECFVLSITHILVQIMCSLLD